MLPAGLLWGFMLKKGKIKFLHPCKLNAAQFYMILVRDLKSYNSKAKHQQAAETFSFRKATKKSEEFVGTSIIFLHF